ncbi:MAG: hypothetical protein OHK0046_03660 [Anaerolineae bacterium]
MNIRVNWANERHSVIYFEIYEGWNWDEFNGGVDKICVLLKNVRRQVDLIFIYYDESSEWPPNAIINLRRYAERDVEQIRFIMLVSGNEIVESVYHLLRRTHSRLTIHAKVQLATTLEEAHGLIA